jgi:hypothetical protein
MIQLINFILENLLGGKKMTTNTVLTVLVLGGILYIARNQYHDEMNESGFIHHEMHREHSDDIFYQKLIDQLKLNIMAPRDDHSSIGDDFDTNTTETTTSNTNLCQTLNRY